MKKTTQKDTFSISGPIHLTTIDWKNAHHRRIVGASLVQGVYVLQRDRRQKRQGTNALAPSWWLHFNFELIHQLVDGSIFGAIYELKNTAKGAPTYVIAFRGTNKLSFQDHKLNLECFKNKLHQTSRYEIALKNVLDMVAPAEEGSNVWLAGHSLGAAIGMLVGKTIAKEKGIFLEAFLFNPPFFSTPIEIIKNEKLKHGIQFFRSGITAAFTVAVKGRCSEDPFVAFSKWVPCIFVNPDDHICSRYIRYFEHRGKMEDIGLGSIERLATQNSLRGLILPAFGGEPVDSEPLHLLPSANLTINRSPFNCFRRAHGLSQWWNPDFHLQSEKYIYRLTVK